MNSKNGFKNYIVKVLNGMALGLFSSLLIGLIIKQLGTLLGKEFLINFSSPNEYILKNTPTKIIFRKKGWWKPVINKAFPACNPCIAISVQNR